MAPSTAPREASLPASAAVRAKAAPVGSIPARPGARRVEPGPLADCWSEEEEQTRRQVLQRRLKAYLRRGRARVIFTDNLHTMVSIKRGQGVLTFRIHRMFAEAPPMVLRAVARYAESHDRDSATLVREFIDRPGTVIDSTSLRPSSSASVIMESFSAATLIAPVPPHSH